MTGISASQGRTRQGLYLAALFLLALLPRLYSVQGLGWDWDHPGSFTLINFDEAGSCRAALEGFDYSTFIGTQTTGIAHLLGVGPNPAIIGNDSAVKAYCHSAEHILIARYWSSFLGSLTVVLLALIALQLVPGQPGIAFTAGGLLALSGFHISHSQSGTVDAASVFFIYAFLALMVYSVRRRWRVGLWLSPLLLLPAVWTKYWVFAVFAYLALLPFVFWQYISKGFTPQRITALVLATAVLFGLVTNPDFQASGLWALLLLYYLFIPWQKIERPMIAFWLLVPLFAWGITQVEIIASYTSSGQSGRFGGGYGAIGWNKWLRNLVNVPSVLIVGLGLPAFWFLLTGFRTIFRGEGDARAWLCLTPVLAFLLYMAFVSPVTYYRHYLPLLPAVALVSAVGLYSSSWASRRWFMVLFFLWPGLLAIDLISDYHRDPRIELRQWAIEHPQSRVFTSFYVSPPNSMARNSRLFQPEYAAGDATILRQAQYLVLSENWYDTAFANELNGPLVNDLERLIKTKPEYATFYRQALAGEHRHLKLEQAMDLQHFMPELLLHRLWYGNFQLFVGDLKVFRVVP